MNAIALNNAKFNWLQGQPVLDIPELMIEQGKKLFIRGPSGSGKTTFLGLLGGIITPQSGSVVVLGEVLSEHGSAQRDHFRAQHIGFIFQMFNLIPYLSVVENVTLPLSFSAQRLGKVLSRGVSPEQEAERLLARLGLCDPQLLNRKVIELSIGQQQRVAASRALIGSPELIIADEPTSALDTENREAFIRLLFAECESAQSTLVFVSHDPSLGHLFDQTIELSQVNKASVGLQKESNP